MIHWRIFCHTVIAVFLFSFEIGAKGKPTDAKCLEIHNRWLQESFVLTKNTVGFSAPVSARAYAYFTVAMYESTIEVMPALRSLSGQLMRYDRTVWAGDPNGIDWCYVANQVDKRVLEYLYRNMPVSYSKRLIELSDSITLKYCKRTSSEIKERSLDYAGRLADQIIEWSKTDGADEGFNKNYPDSYVPPVCPSCWTRTTPGYFSAILPYWGTNLHLINGTEALTEGCEPMEYSTDKGSAMYLDAEDLYKKAKEQKPEHERIAEYWDDSPGYSGTPTGHLMCLSHQLVAETKLDPSSAMELYVKMGLAINEAFINCWRLKYAFNLLRPITYIHRVIDPQFNTFIATPSFPEFPSGHSFQSGAGSEILKSVFSDSMAFTDKTNAWRKDIDGTPRSFDSFTELSEEISISRFYGGIHFKTTLDTSLKYGRMIGVHVFETIKCRK